MSVLHATVLCALQSTLNSATLLVAVQIDMDTKLDTKKALNVFKFNPEFEKAEAEWAAIRKELLGEDSDDEGGDGDESGDDSEGESDEEGPAAAAQPTQVCQRRFHFFYRLPHFIHLAAQCCAAPTCFVVHIFAWFSSLHAWCPPADTLN